MPKYNNMYKEILFYNTRGNRDIVGFRVHFELLNDDSETAPQPIILMTVFTGRK